ncbi:MAG: hypothetical protein HQK49_15215 [Oligoflexia bacterium]|nr:hypothetical protein [Oligoflexia bacterium]
MIISRSSIFFFSTFFFSIFFIFTFVTFVSTSNFTFAANNIDLEQCYDNDCDNIFSDEYWDNKISENDFNVDTINLDEENNSSIYLQKNNQKTTIEPTYCDPNKFANFEVKYNNNNNNNNNNNTSTALNSIDQKSIQRLHLFQLGSVVVAGMAIGKSTTKEMAKLATNYSSSISENSYCTWYVGRTNKVAANKFNYKHISGVSLVFPRLASWMFMRKLRGSFFYEENNFLDCAEKHHYIAVGCDAQKHRGPSVFGMILSFSGCTPRHAAEIVNNIWGLNGVPAKTRFAIIEAAYQLGNSNPIQRMKLQTLFSN